MRKSIFTLLLFSLLFSCKKEHSTLEQALVDNNISQVKTAINSMIWCMGTSGTSDYTEANISGLAQAINNQDNIDATLFCFDCIKTLPSMSEITVTVNSNGNIYSRTIDISYSSSHKMIFQNMHE